MIESLTRLDGARYLQQYGGPFIIGIDEVGLGACAGPVVVAGVVLPSGWAKDTVKDSKRFSDGKKVTAHAKRRKVLEEDIKPAALGHSTLWAAASEVDQYGIDGAVQTLTHMVYTVLRASYPDALVVLDGGSGDFHNRHEFHNTISFPEADGAVTAVSAASILAKVSRDRYMIGMDIAHPGYGFGKHKGYPTKQHDEAIERLGICEEHRRSYKTIARRSVFK